jgi:hypothetical protein
MSNKLRELIERAAAQAMPQLTAIHRGEYRPRVHVVTQGDSLESLRQVEQATAAA